MLCFLPYLTFILILNFLFLFLLFLGSLLGSVPQLQPSLPSKVVFKVIVLDRPGMTVSYPSRLGPILPTQTARPIVELVRGTPAPIQRFLDPVLEDSQLSYAEYTALATRRRRRTNEILIPSSELPASQAGRMVLPTQSFPLQPYGQPPPSVTAQGLRVMETLFANMHAMVANSVVGSTQVTYSTGWNRWISYCLYIGADKFLRTVPEIYHTYRLLSGDPSEWSYQILVCAGYMAYLVNHPTQPVEADPATKYLSAVRYHFTTNGIDVAFMDNSYFLKSARAGLLKEWRQIPGN
jgi:hypothetical protein